MDTNEHEGEKLAEIISFDELKKAAEEKRGEIEKAVTGEKQNPPEDQEPSAEEMDLAFVSTYGAFSKIPKKYWISINDFTEDKDAYKQDSLLYKGMLFVKAILVKKLLEQNKGEVEIINELVSMESSTEFEQCLKKLQANKTHAGKEELVTFDMLLQPCNQCVEDFLKRA